jgi:hypothetical protein
VPRRSSIWAKRDGNEGAFSELVAEAVEDAEENGCAVVARYAAVWMSWSTVYSTAHLACTVSIGKLRKIFYAGLNLQIGR